MLIAILPLLALSAGSVPQQQAAPVEHRQQEGGIMGPYAGHRESQGPTTTCGAAFAIQLIAGESVSRQEGPDFSLFYVTAADGEFLLYEGNHPQPHDDEVLTGVTAPRLIAIHDNRPPAAKAQRRVRERLLVGDAFARACPRERPRP